MRNQISGLESENQMARSFPNKLNRWARPENESAASRNRSTLCFWFGGDKKKIFPAIVQNREQVEIDWVSHTRLIAVIE